MSNDHHKTSPVFLLIVPGCTAIGLGVGILSPNPGALTIVGFGSGLLLWGLIIVFAPRRAGRRSDLLDG